MPTVRLPQEVVATIDEIRGSVPRDRWIREALVDLISNGYGAQQSALKAPPKTVGGNVTKTQVDMALKDTAPPTELPKIGRKPDWK